ncbi:MAG: adenylate/guanylate cyclase domain-containing protein [Treponema sp.]|nr:adenylate/guanylate cyclase domain-containing protein [Treponema sp.]
MKRVTIVRPDGSKYVVIKRVAQTLIPEEPGVRIQNTTPPKKHTVDFSDSGVGQFEAAEVGWLKLNEAGTSVDSSAEKLAEVSVETSEPLKSAEGDSGEAEVSLDDFLSDDADDGNSDYLKEKIKAERIALEKEKEAIKKRAAEEKKAEKARIKAEKKAARIPHPIGAKLIGIISAMVVIALGGVTYLVSYFVSQDVRTSAEENNLAINSRTASDTENRINTTISSVGMFLDLLNSAGDNETEVRSVENMFFDRNKSVAAVYLPGTKRLFVNTAFFVTRELERESVLSYFVQEDEAVNHAKDGSFELLNASLFFNVPLLSIMYPFSLAGAADNVAAVLYSTENLTESFSSGSVNQSFFVNNDGIVLVHSDFDLMMRAGDVSEMSIVKTMLESPANNSQITYVDENGDEHIGAFRKLNIGNGGIITTVKTQIILEGVQATTRRNVYITIAILALAIMIIYFFAKSLSVPLKQLTAVVNEINSGNFNTELFSELNHKSKDEIGVLIKSTQNEREILNTFTKLTNKGVTQAIIKKTIDFEPHLKDVTIFFSDIRGFTAISDGFKNRFGEKSAAEIISFLNDYMSRMVTCITKTGGTVDKFEGDAIMAAWGVLRNESLDWEQMDESSVTRALAKEAHDKYVRDDALSAITCCIAMRYSLMKYNKDAEAFSEAHKDEPLAQYKPHIRIGAGLNSGRATVGFMGSYDKMEFTSIGDAVNFASRTEASNKPCGTDTLITQDTYDILKYDYIRCEENNFTLTPENEKNEIIVEQIPVEFEVKGKGKQHFYGVVNMPQFDIAEFFADDPLFELDEDCAKCIGPNGPRTLSEMRKLLGIDEPNFGQVNLDAEENKIQIATP